MDPLASDAHDSAPNVRRHTGAVALHILGERPRPRSGKEIIETAAATEFVDEAGVEIADEAGSVRLVPRAMGRSVFPYVLTEGLVVGKLTVGESPPKVYRALDRGDYYIHLDFVEGPDFDEGRWIVRIVDGQGEVACHALGAEVKQVISFHAPGTHEAEEHSRPRVELHGVATKETAEGLAMDGDFWEEMWAAWEPFRTGPGEDGCVWTTICKPVG
jgi:hypothetical protein